MTKNHNSEPIRIEQIIKAYEEIGYNVDRERIKELKNNRISQNTKIKQAKKELKPFVIK